MWIVWTVSALSMLTAAACVVVFRDKWTAAPRAWKILAASGLPLALGGLAFIVRFWEPSQGPYLANELYPLGPYVNTWAVSFGFMWLAYGVAFYGLALTGVETAASWLVLFVTWMLAWVPHGVIGIGFAIAGENAGSVQFYQDWASRWQGFLVLAGSALTLLSHFLLSILGFFLTGSALHRKDARVGSS